MLWIFMNFVWKVASSHLEHSSLKVANKSLMRLHWWIHCSKEQLENVSIAKVINRGKFISLTVPGFLLEPEQWFHERIEYFYWRSLFSYQHMKEEQHRSQYPIRMDLDLLLKRYIEFNEKPQRSDLFPRPKTNIWYLVLYNCRKIGENHPKTFPFSKRGTNFR